MNLADYFLGLRRGLQLPDPDVPAPPKPVVVRNVYRCSRDHEEVGWTGTPASTCWVCDRPSSIPAAAT